MTTDTTNNTTANVLDVDQLRAALLDLLTRADAALGYRPDNATAEEYSDRLWALNGEAQELADALSFALPALRTLRTVHERVIYRFAALAEVFGTPEIPDPQAAGLVTDAGEYTFWGDAGGLYPNLHLDYTRQTMLDEDLPF